MNKKPLFDDTWHEPWTDAARELDNEARKAIAPIVAKYAAQGYRLRDVAYILDQAVYLECLVPLTRKQQDHALGGG